MVSLERMIPKTSKIYLVFDIYPNEGKLSKDWVDGMQEWESIDSIQKLKLTLTSIGYKVEVYSNIEHFLIAALKDTDPFLVWNGIEGYSSRNRESYISSIAEALGYACTGSDSYSQITSLDKQLCKILARKSGIPIPKGGILELGDEMANFNELPFPIFLKPRGEGSGIGVSQKSIVHTKEDLSGAVHDLQIAKPSSRDWIWEEYLPGKEYSVSLLQTSPEEWVSVAARITYPDAVYGEEVKSKDAMPESFDLSIDPKKKEIMEEASIRLAIESSWEGYARVDWKEDIHSEPKFLEANLTPGMSYIYSLYPKILMESKGWTYEELIYRIINISIQNYETKKRYNYGKNKSILRRSQES